jgi:COP9 signalosome complex subunit 8
LITIDRPPARYALQRLPDSLSSLPLSRALSALIIYTMNRQHAQLYEQATALMNLVSQPDFFDKDLGSLIHTLTTAFLGKLLRVYVLRCAFTDAEPTEESFRQRTFELLSKAYTSLPSSLACTYLGLRPEQTINGKSLLFHIELLL